MMTTKLMHEGVQVLGDDGHPLFELELRNDGVNIISNEGRWLAWFPSACMVPTDSAADALRLADEQTMRT